MECFHVPSLVSDLELYYCGIEKVVPSFNCGPYIRDRYLIHYIVSGKGFFEYRDRKHAVTAGEIFVIVPGELTYYETDPDDPWTFCWFAFDGRRAKEMLNRAGLSMDEPVQAIRGGDRLPVHVNELIATLQAYSGRELPASLIHGLLYQLFGVLEVSHLASRSDLPRRSDAADYVGKALKFIEYQYQSPIAVKNIADYVGLERTYFTKLFTKATGESPQRYLIKYRIDQARRLLATSDMTVAQIGRSVGIPELAYFSRLYKKIVGTAPKQHGKAMQGGQQIVGE